MSNRPGYLNDYLRARGHAVRVVRETAPGVYQVRLAEGASQAEQDAADLDALTYALTAAKRNRLDEVDRKTEKLIAKGGFSYAGKLFSLSPAAQLNHRRFEAIPPPFPLLVNTKDDMDSEEIATAAQMTSFRVAAASALNDYLVAATDLKEQIRAATTQAELDAVVDDR